MNAAILPFTSLLISCFVHAASPSSTIKCGAYPDFTSDYSVTFSSTTFRDVTAHIENKANGLKVDFKCVMPKPCVDVPGRSSCGSRGVNDQQIYVCDDGVEDGQITKPVVELILAGTQLSSHLRNFGRDSAQLLCRTKTN